MKLSLLSSGRRDAEFGVGGVISTSWGGFEARGCFVRPLGALDWGGRRLKTPRPYLLSRLFAPWNAMIEVVARRPLPDSSSDRRRGDLVVTLSHCAVLS